MTTNRRRRRSRWHVAPLLAVFAALAAGLAPATAQPALAATPDLTLTADTSYDVDPDKNRVHVTVNLTATNHLKDTKTRQFYFDRAYLAVQPGTVDFKVTSRTGSPSVHVVARKADHTLLRIDFGGRLPAGASRAFGLTFDIADPGGAPTRQIRIGASLVTFPAWAFASDSTPGGTVTVTFPPGFNVEVQSDQLGEPTTDETGRIVYRTGTLAQPLAFFAYFVADRPNAYTETHRSVEIDGRPLEITIRAWPDDPAWAERVGSLLETGVPALSKAIGLPWLGERPLVVAEAISRSTSGFSGRYDPATGRIEIAYYADSLVVLHEGAHAWFDGSLLADRWATEGFASLYALQAATSLGEKVTAPPLTPELTAARMPLNAWGPAGTDATAGEDYGYAASAELARLIAERAGPTGLQSVWEAARTGVGAYQPAGLSPAGRGMATMSASGGAAAASDVVAIEAGSPPPDWRGLLDLLEDRTGARYDDLWRVWVVRHEDASLLDARSDVRRRYEEIVTRAGEWQLPVIVRQAMRAWQFDQARELLDAANRVLDDRDAVTLAAREAGLKLPSGLEAAFESDRGFVAAAAEADAELATIEAYGAAAAARPASPDIIEQVGMWWATPDADLSRAAEAFSTGDLHESVSASIVARLTWQGARELGRNRVMTMIAALLAAGVAVTFLVGRVRSFNRRRSRRRYIAQARPAGDGGGR
jgi:hypothetical protein